MTNNYDKDDIVRRESMLKVNGLKIASYRVKDVETGEFSKLQYHMTHENTVLAVMGEDAAKLFSTMVNGTRIKELEALAKTLVDAMKDMDDESNILFRAYIGEVKIDKDFRDIRGTAVKVQKALAEAAKLGIVP